ncbi:MAG: hypothetical protein QG604_657 [Candidatus Dependentiae bacterium]|nr:hypothetical protein [Candidatus Dependentiae bacterium]
MKSPHFALTILIATSNIVIPNSPSSTEELLLDTIAPETFEPFATSVVPAEHEAYRLWKCADEVLHTSTPQLRAWIEDKMQNRLDALHQKAQDHGVTDHALVQLAFGNLQRSIRREATGLHCAFIALLEQLVASARGEGSVPFSSTAIQQIRSNFGINHDTIDLLIANACVTIGAEINMAINRTILETAAANGTANAQ